jgi:3-dehydroquinate dehydratase/shikimate dehydrogenase
MSMSTRSRSCEAAVNARKEGLPFQGVVASALPEDTEEGIRAQAAVPRGAAAFELRADLLRAGDAASIVRRAGVPTIVTVRRPEDGGRFGGSEEERRGILAAALDAGADAIDLEVNRGLAGWAAALPPERVVLSHHGARCVARELDPIFDRMRSHPARRLKIVPRAERLAECGAIADLLRRAAEARRPLAAFATGGSGFATRIFALSWGSWGTYGAALPGLPTAEGQPPAGDLLEVYRADALGEATLRFGLAGRGVLASPSPFLHAAAYRDRGIDAVYVPLETEALQEALALCMPSSPLRLGGLGVTIPLKESAAGAAARLDPFVEACGAANTLALESGGVVAFNTDGPAIVDLVRREIGPSGRTVVVVGAGGTARAAAVALRDAGARVVLFNRTAERAQGVAHALGLEWDLWERLPGAAWDVLVQATPLGREGEGVLPDSAIRGRVVVDAAYGARPTPLVTAARSRGLAVFDGLDLLAAQARLQFRALTGREAAVSVFDGALAAVRRRFLTPHVAAR